MKKVKNYFLLVFDKNFKRKSLAIIKNHEKKLYNKWSMLAFQNVIYPTKKIKLWNHYLDK